MIPKKNAKTNPIEFVRQNNTLTSTACAPHKPYYRTKIPPPSKATVQHWFTHYQADDAAAVRLVEKLERADWQFKRTQKRLDEGHIGPLRLI